MVGKTFNDSFPILAFLLLLSSLRRCYFCGFFCVSFPQPRFSPFQYEHYEAVRYNDVRPATSRANLAVDFRNHLTQRVPQSALKMQRPIIGTPNKPGIVLLSFRPEAQIDSITVTFSRLPACKCPSDRCKVTA